MDTNLKIGIGSASGILIGGLGGYLVSRKFHKKAADQVAHEVMEEVVPSVFQTLTMMFTGVEALFSKEHEDMSDEELGVAYQKMLADGFEFFNLTMKEKYGVSMQLEMRREPSED
jgi:hypothetical protein